MEVITVGIGEYRSGRETDVLETYSLGSCVGVALYDPYLKIGGLAHILLPASELALPPAVQKQPGKYADTALKKLVEELAALGASRMRLIAKIAGGACMFSSVPVDSPMNIGLQNVAAVRKNLSALGIALIAEDTGRNYGRTVRFFNASGTLVITSAVIGSIEL